MGGSGDYGGTSNYGGGGGGGNDKFDCAQLSFEAMPRLKPGHQMAEGDVLSVQMAADRVVELRDHAGTEVGTVVDNLVDLIRCLEEGQAFQATVAALEPAVVVVVSATSE